VVVNRSIEAAQARKRSCLVVIEHSDRTRARACFQRSVSYRA
jgi:hypothetical protein